MARAGLCVLAALALAACGSRAPEDTTPAPRRAAAEPAAAHMTFLAPPLFDDLDPHDWAGITPAAYAVHGIDVSR